MADLKIPPPSKLKSMMRDELEAAINALPDADAAPLYYITDDDGEEVDASADFCREHALMVQRAEQIMTGKEHWIGRQSMGSDSIRLCDWRSCGRPLDAGGFTDYGIDSALGLTETNPLRVSVYVAELSMASGSMMHKDERWPLWEHHARTLLVRNARRKS